MQLRLSKCSQVLTWPVDPVPFEGAGAGSAPPAESDTEFDIVDWGQQGMR